ncbi:MAG: hypothetical protein NTW87_29650 [Planctomycetota bacterium]|nr:hypothetical protein [Planctomycetota bacterium]
MNFAFCIPLSAADPSYYQKKATWYETLIAAREAVRKEQGETGKRVPLPDFGKDPFTIVAWVKTSAGGTIFAKAPAEGKWAPQGKSFFVRDGKLGYDIGWVACVTSRRSVADNAWHHVAITGPNSYEFFVDGEPDQRGDLKAEPDIQGYVAKIGYTSTDFPSPSPFSGLLDEVRVYKARLSAAQIKALYEKPGAAPPGTADALAGYWPFNGDTSDASGSQNHGALQGKDASFGEGKDGKALALNGNAHVLVAGSRTEALGAGLWDLLKRDFPDAGPAAQIEWERQDKLYDADWNAGDFADLAGRYARATRTSAWAEQARQMAANAKDLAGLQAVRDLYLCGRRLEAATAHLRDLNTAALRQALADLSATFGSQYPRGAEYLARLDALEKALAGEQDKTAARTAGQASSGTQAVLKAGEELPRLRHAALVEDNPLLDFGKLLFIKRKTYQSSHYYTDYIDGCKFYGGNICALDLKTRSVTDLVPQLKDGIFGRFDLSYDAKRVVFDCKVAPGKGFRIFEVGIDGQGLRQLTFDAPDEQELVKKYRNVRTPTGIPYDTGTDDMHPCYLPTGDIVFVTTRCQKGILCDGPDVLTSTVLYRMDKDGRTMRPLSFNSVSEATPSITQDGRILYTRWEYVDKGGSACKCIWAMNPDGTRSVEIYANNIAHPVTFIDCRDIPGEPNTYVVVGAPHMPLGVGAIIRLDTRYSLRTTEPMTSLTPEIFCPDEHGYQHLRNGKWVHDLEGPLFREPYPLSRKYFLVTYNPDKPWNEVAGYGLYLLDEFGNRELIYKDAEYSCWEPYPLRPRPLPTLIPPASEEGKAVEQIGTLLLQDVYVGLTGIQRGRVKYLRVMEDCPRPWAARRRWGGDEIGQQHAAVSFGGHLAPKIEHGVVPVEPDGSAHFTVPADKNVFFQALDENYMELQRMRTFVNLRPGEYRGCVGCHEEKALAPGVTARFPDALRHPPLKPVAQPGEVVPRPMHYPTDVQPLLDKHCVACHSAGKPNGIDLSGTLTELFCVSYENLVKKRWAGNVIDEIGISGTGGKHANIASTDPLVYGSHTSKLVALLRKGHYDAKLSQEEFIRLVTWIDANAPYYGTWEGRRNIRYKDLPDFRPAPKAGPGATAWSGGSDASTAGGHR